MLYYFNSENPAAPIKLGKKLASIVSDKKYPDQEIIILCIGSDRSTGDSLGPVIGYMLKKRISTEMYIVGDLNNPVHATNLSHYINSIYRTFDNPFVIALDASVGRDEHIGYITLGEGPLRPGLGVKKRLPEVGDIHITGIVNSSECMEYSSLQTTRLSVIIRMADAIACAIDIFNNDYYTRQEPARLYQQSLISL